MFWHKSSSFPRVVRLGLLAGCLLLLSGCVSGIVLPRIGTRTDQVALYERTMSNGDELIVYYQINRYAGESKVRGRRVVAGISKWSRVDLRTVSWVPLTAGRRSASPEIVLTIEDGPRTALAADFSEIPIVTIPLDRWLTGGPALSSFLLSATEPHAISFVQYEDPGGPGQRFAMLVRRDASGQLVCNDRVRPPARDYETWWALPARIAAAPFTVAADVLLSPFYLGCLLFSCRM